MTRSDPTETTLLRGRLVLPYAVVEDGLLVVRHGQIAYAGALHGWTEPFPDDVPPEPVGTILPGMVDVHCHGGGGATVTTTDPDQALVAAHHHHRSGTTRVVASLVTAAREDLLAQTAALAPLVRSGDFAGLHLEGPFLSAARCGAQRPHLMCAPDTGLVADLLDAGSGGVRQMTLAPELAGAEAVADQLGEAGVVVALGHSDADYPTYRAALRRLEGRGHVTHLGNGMPPLHHRAPGPVTASLVAANEDRATVELVADGTHLAPGFAALVFAAAADDAVVLVTDAMAAAGMPDGEYQLGDQRVQVSDGVARLAPGTEQAGSIAGGTAHLLDEVRHVVTQAQLPLPDAVRAASLTPASVLGAADRYGALLQDRVADLLVVDDDLALRRVMRDGEWLT